MQRLPALFGLVLAAVLILMPVRTHAQPSNEINTKVMVTMEITIGTESPVVATTRLGELVTYDNRSYQVSLGIRPTEVDLERKTAALEIVALEGRRGHFRERVVVDELSSVVGEPRATSFEAALVDIKVVEITIVAERGRSQTESGETMGLGVIKAPIWEETQQAGQCCVTCGFVQTCACEVRNACGSCKGTC